MLTEIEIFPLQVRYFHGEGGNTRVPLPLDITTAATKSFFSEKKAKNKFRQKFLCRAAFPAFAFSCQKANDHASSFVFFCYKTQHTTIFQ